MPIALYNLLALLAPASALVATTANARPISRRSVIGGAAAFAVPLAAHSKGEDARAASAAREAAEAAARQPANRLNAARTTLVGVADSLQTENPSWDAIREALSATPPQRVAGNGFDEGVEGVAFVVRTATSKEGEGRKLRAALLKQLNEIETFAYNNQSALPASFSGYCAPGVVPREEKGACKVRPVVDKAPVVAKVKEALATFDALLKLV